MTIAERIKEAAVQAATGEQPSEINKNCIHRGPVLRTINRPCCGLVAVFHCSKLGREVESTKCRSCTEGTATVAINDVPARLHPAGAIGLVISSRGDAQLPLTVASARRACPGLQIQIVNDSDNDRLPEEELLLSLNARIVRAPERMGCARGRYLGAALLLRDMRRMGIRLHMLGFSDDHQAFEEADPRVVEFRRAMPSFRIPSGIFDRIGLIAAQTGGIAYAGCSGHYSAELQMREGHSVPRCFWCGKPDKPSRMSGFMGAFYFAPVPVYEKLGGWIALPGHIGWDEEAMSIYATRCGVPITCVPDVQTWHEFDSSKRPTGYSYPAYQVNLAAMWRLLLDDAAWARVRQHLATGLTLDKKLAPIPEHILREAEAPELLAYGEQLRARYTLTDDEAFLHSIGWEV